MAETLLLSSGRVSAVEASLTDGSPSPLILDTKGRLLVASKPAGFTVQSAGLVAVNDALAVNVEDSGSIVLHVKNYGTVTMAAGTFVFEASLDSTTGSDGTWFSIQGLRTSVNVAELNAALSGIVAGAGNTYGWRFGTAGYKWIRVRCTVAVTASSIAFWQALESPEAIEVAPSVPTHAVSGTGTFTVAGTATVTPVTGTTTNVVTAATTNAQVVKASGGVLYELTFFNPTAAIIYVKLYNKATAPTVGTDVPIVTIPVPINGLVSLEHGFVGKRFTTGIALAVTAGPLATDVAVVAVGAQLSLSYV